MATTACAVTNDPRWRGLAVVGVMKRIFSRENLWALLLCLILILLVIFTAGSAPLWIYQGY